MKEENVSVAAPDTWMAGWEKIYSQMLEAPDEELSSIEVGHTILMLKHAMRITETDPEKTSVLELASGSGDVACYLAKMGAQVEAIEALSNAVALTNRRAKLLGVADKVDAVLSDIDSWEIQNESYDIVIALQCLQYLFERAIPRMRELIAAVKPGGFFVYSGNILPHFKTEPEIRFVTEHELRSELQGWTFHSFGTDQALIKPGDIRGYIWTVARKPK